MSTRTRSRAAKSSWLSVGLVFASGCEPDQSTSVAPTPTEAGRTKSLPGSTKLTQTGEDPLLPPPVPERKAAVPDVDDAALKKIAAGVTVTASVAKRVYQPLEPIEVEYTVHNAHKVFFTSAYPGSSRSPFPIRVEDASGQPVPETAIYRRMAKIDVYSIRGAIFYDRPNRGVVVANWAYDMTDPGVYRVCVDVAYEVGMKAGKVQVLHAVSDPIEVTVKGTPISALPPPPPGRGSGGGKPHDAGG